MKQNKLNIIANVILALIALLLICQSFSYQREGPTTKSVTDITQAFMSINENEFKPISLPYTVSDLKARTPVSVQTTIHPNRNDCIYIQTLYSPAKVYANGKLIFEFGKEENYPNFILDPARELKIIELDNNENEDVQIQIDYLSPKTRKELKISPMLLGTSKEIIMERSRTLGTPFIFSLVQIVSGFTLMFVAICIAFVEKKGIIFFWLGSFSALAGSWFFCINTFSDVIFKENTLLYICGFIGMFIFIIPLIRFTRQIINFNNSKPLFWMEYFFTALALLAVFLQFKGIVSFSSIEPLYHLLLPASIVLLFILTLNEYIRYDNIHAKKYLLPILILSISALLETINFKLSLTNVFTSIFQTGILIFMLIMGISAGIFIKDSLNLQNKEKEILYQEKLLEMQTKELKNTSMLLAKNEQIVRQQRHDLRHHLIILEELSKNKEIMLDYIHTLIEQVPPADYRFCENEIVNAVVSHYAILCKEKNITYEYKLDIPETNSSIIDSSLCAIVSNLLENAIEACTKVEEKHRYIRLHASMQYKMLTITMDNSFNGIVYKHDTSFFSTKRDDIGIGTASIHSLAKKLNGEASFDYDLDTFYSSVFIEI